MSFFGLKIRKRLNSRNKSSPAIGVDLDIITRLLTENKHQNERIQELESIIESNKKSEELNNKVSSLSTDEEKQIKKFTNIILKLQKENRNLRRDLSFNKARVRYFRKKGRSVIHKKERISYRISFENKNQNRPFAKFRARGSSKDDSSSSSIIVRPKRKYSVGSVSSSSALCMERFHDRLKIENQKSQISLLQKKILEMEEKFAIKQMEMIRNIGLLE